MSLAFVCATGHWFMWGNALPLVYLLPPAGCADEFLQTLSFLLPCFAAVVAECNAQCAILSSGSCLGWQPDGDWTSCIYVR